MKKILVVFFVVIASLSGFSQSFSVDNKSLSVPRYANQTAMSAAIPSPTVGMLVYNNALNQYAYWNGSAWTNFPTSGGGGGTSLWSLNGSNRLVVAGSPTPVGVDVPDFAVSGFTKLSNDATTTTSGVTRSSPAIKQVLLTGTITAAASPETSASLTTTIPHGITNYDKIISVEVILKARVLSAGVPGGFFELAVPPSFNDNRPSPGGTNGFEFTYLIGANSIEIIRVNNNSNNLGRTNVAGTQGTSYAAPYRILITYTN
jgi:type II secretory pathway pseudopilin PulG